MVKMRPLHQKNGLLMTAMMREGYTIKSLAKASEVHYLTVWRIVNEQHKPNKTTKAKLCDLLNQTPKELGLE
ncbi:MAG: helix-turn-helix domain-containing protein [Lentisphaeria bacterium]|nr:helix-turn-helix domain-containing protein [Lentisphaeria bacterium]